MSEPLAGATIAELLDAEYGLLEELWAIPECGKDFCDACGDCLHCYGGDLCPMRPEHRWVVYHERICSWREEHPEAQRYDAERDEYVNVGGTP